MVELLAAILEALTPRSRVGKAAWVVVAGLCLALGIVELLAAFGH